MVPPLYAGLGALGCAALGVWCVAEGMTGEAIFMTVGAFCFALPIYVKRSRGSGAPKMRAVATAIGLWALIVGVAVVYYSDTVSYVIREGELTSDWLTLGSLSVVRVPMSPPRTGPCTGANAFTIRTEVPNASLLLSHNFVPIDRTKFPIAGIEFSVASEVVRSGDLAVALEIGDNQHLPRQGLSIADLRPKEDAGLPSACTSFRVPIDSFGIANQPLYGIRFLIRKPGTTVFDGTRLVAPSAVAARTKGSRMQFLVELIITYLLVGMCVQLPGVAWGHFLRLRWFRPVADAGWPIKVLAGLPWLCFTAVFWPIQYLSGPLNLFAIELVALGLIGSILVCQFVPASCTLLVVVGCAALSIFLARRRFPR